MVAAREALERPNQGCGVILRNGQAGEPHPRPTSLGGPSQSDEKVPIQNVEIPAWHGWMARIHLQRRGMARGRARTGPLRVLHFHFPVFGTVRYGMYSQMWCRTGLMRCDRSLDHPAFSAACDSACITSSVMLKSAAQRSRILGAPRQRQHEKEVGGAPF